MLRSVYLSRSVTHIAAKLRAMGAYAAQRASGWCDIRSSCQWESALLAVFCLALAVFFWGEAIERTRQERVDEIREVNNDNENLAMALEEHTNRTFKTADQALLLLEHEYRRYGKKLDIHELVAARAIDPEIFIFLGVVDAQGNMILANLPFAPTGVADREYFSFHREHKNDTLFIGKPTQGRITGKWAVQLSRRIDNADGSFGGVVVAGMDPAYFTAFYRQPQLGSGGLVALLGMDGIMRARRAGNVTSFGENIRSGMVFAAQAKSPTGSFLSTGQLDGVRRFISYRKLAQYPLIVVVGTSESETLAQFYKRQRNYYGTAALGSLLIIIFGTAVIAAFARQRRTYTALEKSEARYRATFDQAAIGIVHMSLDGRFLQVNQKICDMLGYTEAELTGLAVRDVCHPDDLPLLKSDRARMESGEIQTCTREFRYVRKDGAVGWINRGLSLVRDASGEPQYFISVSEDVTARRDLQDRLQQLAHFDGLTHLPNRVLCTDRLRQALIHAQRNAGKLAVLLLDVDRFSAVNDSLGRALGDRLLRAIARRLSDSVRAHDTVARLAGDEFAIILSDIVSADETSTFAARLLQSLHEPFRLDEHEVFVTASIGIAVFPDHGEDAEALMRNAEAALYCARKMGSNQYCYYAAQMSEQTLKKMHLANNLHHALERHEFLLHFQPKVPCDGTRITGCEALLRWRTADGELVPPAIFIPTLEETGLIAPVGEWVIRAACMQVSEWQRMGLRPVPIAVNLSARQFRQQDVADIVRRTLREFDLEPRWLELEITETAAMDSAEETIALLGRLKAIGVGIAIDDFGTGYSSLSYLKRFPVDSLKLDRSFVMGLPDNSDDASIAKAVITMAHSLNLRVIAEGVENEAQCAYLVANQCDEMQGYLFSHPLSAADITRQLRAAQQLEHTASTPIGNASKVA